MATWDNILTQRDKDVFALSGYGKRAGFGQRPAVLVIDVNYNFVGDKPEPILESVKRFRNSCGAEAWDKGNEIVEEIAPQAGDIVVRKQKPSAFFGTPLISMLNEVHADSVLITGTTTSGCVRASVIDALSLKEAIDYIRGLPDNLFAPAL